MERKCGEDTYFGVCPECHDNDGYLNVHRTHWYICHEHRVRWWVGWSLFSTWRFETPEDWQENWELIRDYREVEPHRIDETDVHEHGGD